VPEAKESTMTSIVQSQSQNQAQIRQLMAERETAMRARDAERLVSGYAPEIVKFDLAPPLRYTGPEAHDVNRRRSWFAGFDGPIDYEIRDLTVTVGEDVAFCHSLNRLSAKPRGTPNGFTLWFRATVCLRKVDGTWRITHEHNSTPFYMDGSFKAALDLQP
jgi:ketosteroid isomerase-like protein